MKKQLILCCLALGTAIHAQTPVVTEVSNSASLRPVVSPGAIVSIFGFGFGKTRADTAVTVGGLDTKMLFVSDRQINVQFPLGLSAGLTTLHVTAHGSISEAVPVTVSDYAPAVFTSSGNGSGHGVFTHASGLVTPLSPALPGETVTAYVVGIGRAESADAASPTVEVAGLAATIETARVSPGQVGVYELKFTVPREVIAGDQNVVISIGGIDSPAVTLPIGPSMSPTEKSLATASQATSGIVYTCDPSVNALPGVCNTLNTTIAGLYSKAFANANANIYITLGFTGSGQNVTNYNEFSYSTFRNALIASATDANDFAAAASEPSANPFGKDLVDMTNANARALGLPATSGLTSSTAFCLLSAPGCYDGVIEISKSLLASGGFYFRTGSIGPDQIDFYTAVEHETDEVLGAASCAFDGNPATDVCPADLFRYHSNHTRSFLTGDNSPCASSSATNACFSLEGVTMLQQYNNIDLGEDAGDWGPNCQTPHVQDAVICNGAGNLDISPNAEILVLDVVGYTTVPGSAPPAAFFNGQVSLGSGVYYLQFPNGNVFGYYNVPAFPIFYHYDLGFEAFIDGGNGAGYLYDFTTGHWFYTSSSLFPYLYDFKLNNWLYYFPATNNPGHYTTNPRYFSDLTTGKIITM